VKIQYQVREHVQLFPVDGLGMGVLRDFDVQAVLFALLQTVLQQGKLGSKHKGGQQED